MRELSVSEQRYQAVLAAIKDGATTARPGPDRCPGDWVSRRASSLGVITVDWQQIVLGRAAAGRELDVGVTDEVVQVYDGDHLLRTQLQQGRGEVRKKRASIPGGRTRLNPSVTHPPE